MTKQQFLTTMNKIKNKVFSEFYPNGDYTCLVIREVNANLKEPYKKFLRCPDNFTFNIMDEDDTTYTSTTEIATRRIVALQLFKLYILDTQEYLSIDYVR
jgi:hypothetical protein